MRSCIYCGRELAAGERCDCAQAMAHRQAKDAAQAAQADKADTQTKTKTKTKKGFNFTGKHESAYRTGYTRKESPFTRSKERSWAKREAKRNSKDTNGFWTRLWQAFKGGITAPVDSVMNPRGMGWPIMTSVWAIQGAIITLCLFFVMTNTKRGVFSLMASMLALNGMAGYKTLGIMVMYMISGALAGVLLFFLYTGVFFLINRFIFRARTPYIGFCQRLAQTSIPFALLALLGIVFSMLSTSTLAILMITGAISWVILTYEALRTEWIGYRNGRVLYAVMLGFFVISSVLYIFVTSNIRV